MGDLIDGIMGIPRAFSLIGSRRIVRYVIIAGMFGLILGVALGLIIYFSYDDIGRWLQAIYPWEWGSDVIAAISKWLALLLGLILLVFSFKYLVIILLGPILSYISEIVEEELTGNKGQAFNIRRLFYEIGRSLRINLRNIIKELLYTILLFFAGLFTGLSFITAPIILLIQAYYMGFGNLDFLLERHYSYRESVRFVESNRLLAIGNGMGFLILFAIPIIGFILAPVLSAIGATVEGLERMDNFDLQN